MTLTEYIFACLIAWRFCRFFIHDNGPFLMFDKFRRMLGAEPNPAGVWVGEPGTAADWITCIACFSTSIGVLVFVFHFFDIMYWLMPFAISTGTLILNSLFARAERT